MITRKVKTFKAIDSVEKLGLAVGELSRAYSGQLLLFRGQRQLHPNIRSGRSRPDVRVVKEVVNGWRPWLRNCLALTCAAMTAALLRSSRRTSEIDKTQFALKNRIVV